MAYEHITSEQRPRALGWVLAFGTLTTVFGLSLLLYLTGSRIERSLSRLEVGNALADEDLNRAERIAFSAVQPTPELLLYDTVVTKDLRQPLDRQHSIIKGLFESLGSFRRNQMLTGQEKFHQVVQNSIQPLLLQLKDENSIVGMRLVNELPRVLDRAQRFAESYGRIDREEEILEVQLRQIQSRMESLESRFALISTSAGELFSLIPVPMTVSSVGFTSPRQIKSLPIYEDGVLKDIPQLKGLPNGIHSLVALRDLLFKAGGTVSLPHDEFVKTLDGLRFSTRTLLKSYRTNVDESDRLRAAMNQSGKAKRLGADGLSREVERATVLMTSPIISPLAPWDQLMEESQAENLVSELELIARQIYRRTSKTRRS